RADGDDAFTVDRAHPAWRLTHPHAGELILVARPNCFFADPFSPRLGGIAGDHGGPQQSTISMLITGGDTHLRRRPDGAGPEPSPPAGNADIGVTAAWILGVRRPRRVDGHAVSPELSGRPLREAFE